MSEQKKGVIIGKWTYAGQEYELDHLHVVHGPEGSRAFNQSVVDRAAELVSGWEPVGSIRSRLRQLGVPVIDVDFPDFKSNLPAGCVH